MKRYSLIGIPVLLLVLIPLSLWWFSEKQVIVRRSEQLMAMLSIDAGTNTILRHAKVLGMKSMLAPQVEISSPDIERANGEFASHDLESAYSWICRNVVASRFVISDFRSVTIRGDHAVVVITVDGFMQLPSDKPVDGKSVVTLRWIKRNGNWRLRNVIWTRYERHIDANHGTGER
jgi:predicted neuraminidase